jgi:hypothetical protein
MSDTELRKVHVFENVLTKEQADHYSNLFWEMSVEDVDNPRPRFNFLSVFWKPFGHDEPTYGAWVPDVTIAGLVFWAEKFFLEHYDMVGAFELKRTFVHIMNTGAEIEAHVDDGDVYEGKPKIERHYSGILILNDDYEGGELYFNDLDIRLKPPAGSLVLFRGDEERNHGVSEVTAGRRISMPIFFRDWSN